MGYKPVKRNLENRVESLKEKYMPESDLELILDFKKEAEARVSTKRTLFYINRIKSLVRLKETKFEDMNKEDIKEFIVGLEEGELAKRDGEKYSTWSIRSFIITLKKLFQIRDGYEWDSQQYPEAVDWLSTERGDVEKKYDILSEEEIKKMVKSASKVRDKAFVISLYESGARVGEFLPLKIKDVEFNEHGVKLYLKGKTGTRKVLLVSASPHLSNWLEHHPKGDKREAPLWTSYRGTQLSYNGARGILKKAAEKAGVDKPVNPHNFRHSRATHLANELTEAQMCEYFGWVQGSDQPATYVHLSGRDVDNAILNVYGIKTDEKESNGEKLKIKKCPRCGKKNSPEAEFCNRCGAPLTEEAKRKRMEKEIEEKKKEFNREEFKTEIIQELKSELEG